MALNRDDCAVIVGITRSPGLVLKIIHTANDGGGLHIHWNGEDCPSALHPAAAQPPERRVTGNLAGWGAAFPGAEALRYSIFICAPSSRANRRLRARTKSVPS